MSVREFIRKHRWQIDSYIKSVSSLITANLNDEERELWVMNDEYLYRWAKESGVEEL